MNPMKPLLLLIIAAAGLPCPRLPAAPASGTRSDPASAWAFDYESSVLWGIGDNTTIDYVLMPQVFSVRTPAHGHFSIAGRDLSLRARFSLLAEPVARGPESLYLGFSASPSLEYWLVPGKTCWFTSVGGGCGFIDSGDVEGGQGQDFTLNWFATTGVRTYFRDNLAFTAGIFFQHMSNGGATDPNPGIDALGPSIGLTWTF